MGTDGFAYLSDERKLQHWEAVLPDFRKALDKPYSLCISNECPDTNWGGWHRLHARRPACPAADTKALRSSIETIGAVIERLKKVAAPKDRLAEATNERTRREAPPECRCCGAVYGHDEQCADRARRLLAQIDDKIDDWANSDEPPSMDFKVLRDIWKMFDRANIRRRTGF